MENFRGRTETLETEKQQYDPAGLGDGDKNKIHQPAFGSASSSSDVANMMNVSNGFNNGMDYNQMMQFMSGNMGGGMANFNPMMGEFDRR